MDSLGDAAFMAIEIALALVLLARGLQLLLISISARPAHVQRKRGPTTCEPC